MFPSCLSPCRLLIQAGIFAAFVMGGAPASAQQIPAVPHTFAGIDELIEQHPRLKDLHATCPADLLKAHAADSSQPAPSVSIDDEQCLGDPVECVARCLRDGYREACLASAEELEKRLSNSKRYYVEILYAHGCASGSAEGCAKRAYGILHGDYESDPFNNKDEVEVEVCAFRTASLSCEGGSAAGCTMLGEAYQWGTGVAVDVSAARRAYERSCEIAPDSWDCEVAKGDLSGLP